MGEALTIELRHEQGCAIVTVAGEIDYSALTALRERLFDVAASGAPLVVDLDRVSCIDSVGLATLVGAANRAAAHGGSLQVACARPKIRQLVRLTGLDCRSRRPALWTRRRSSGRPLRRTGLSSRLSCGRLISSGL